MAIRGQRPTPNVVKFATGNPGHRPINDQEPKPTGDAVRPTFVKGKSRKLWEQYAPDLIKQGVLKSWDSHSFGRLCCEWAAYEKNPESFTTARMAEMRKHESQYGLGDPGGRSRIKGNGKDSPKQTDPAAEFYGGRSS